MSELIIDPVLYSGPPENLAGAAPRERRCYEFLDGLGIEYKRAAHGRADTIEDCRGVERLLGAPIPKNLFLCNRQKTVFYLLVMPGDKPFKTKYLSAQIGSARLSFASGEDMEKYLDTHPGSATVLGLLNDGDGLVKLLIDRDLLELEAVGVHPCENTATLRLRTADIIEKFLPAVRHVPTYVELPSEPE